MGVSVSLTLLNVLGFLFFVFFFYWVALSSGDMRAFAFSYSICFLIFDCGLLEVCSFLKWKRYGVDLGKRQHGKNL